MAFVTSEPNKINVEDVQFSTSVSEAVGNKLASSLNYVIDNFDIYEFGVSGGVYSGLSTYPYYFNGTIENLRSDCVITDILIYNEISGTSGSTTFAIERQAPGGGAFATIFTVNPVISNTAADNLFFKMSDVSAPSGVTLPVIPGVVYPQNEKFRFVILGAATDAQNLSVKVITRPV